MYARCPHCSTIFRITALQLTVAQGWVRCGQCRSAFDALGNLADQAEGFAPVAASVPVTPVGGAISPGPIEIESRANVAPPAEEAEEAFDLVNAPPITMYERAVEPETVRSGWAGTLAWTSVNLFLIVLLVAQYVYFTRDDLARYPELRPSLEAMCGVMGCEIPLMRDVKRISLVNRELRSHPDAANALLVKAALINNTSYPQPYPVLQLSLSTVTGQVVAARRFQPVEYLGKAINIKEGMVPQKPVEVVLELVDPGQNAISFEFEFL
ncbi:MAG: zinc-ribbon domain-containing protein [Gammaproteobacteria bacterium]